MTREQAIEAMAEASRAADGNHIIRWQDVPDDDRAIYVEDATVMLDALIGAGWTGPDDWEQVGWIMCTDGSYWPKSNGGHAGRCPDCVPISRRVKP